MVVLGGGGENKVVYVVYYQPYNPNQFDALLVFYRVIIPNV